MREIKFRGKRVDNGEWAYGYYFRSLITTRQEDRHIIAMPDKLGADVDPATVGQYVCKDTEGADIYVGDIVRVTSVMDEVSVGEVVWDEKCAKYTIEDAVDSMDFDNIEHCDKHIEVIGNVFDNPELLKEEEHAQ